MPRHVFCLVYMEDPASAEIFRQNEFVGDGELQPGAVRRVKRPSWTECDGKILRTGKIHLLC